MDLISRWGELEHVIQNIVSEYDVDEVVMGTQGASGLSAALVGSQTQKVARSVSCPLIAIPEQCQYHDPERILLASDNRGLSRASVLDPLKEILRTFHSQVLILNVLEEGQLPSTEQAAEGIRLDRYLEGYPHTYHFAEAPDVESGIQSFVEGNEVDMIVIVNREHDLLDRLLHKSVTRKMVHHTHLPLLVLHDSHSG